MGKLKNEKAAGKDEVTKEMIKGGDEWPLRLVLWRRTGVLLSSFHKGKGERTECNNYRGIGLLSVV